MTEKKTKTLSHTKRMILWAVSEKPSTVRELSEVVGVSRRRIDHSVTELLKASLLFSRSHTKTAGLPARVFEAHIKHPDPRSLVIGKFGKQAPMLAQIIDAIEQVGEPMTVAEIAEFIGVRQESVRMAVKYYHTGAGAGRLRVGEWVYVPAQGHGWKPRYSTSPGKDAAKPPRSSSFSRNQWAKQNRAIQRMQSQRSAVQAGKSSQIYRHPFAQLFAVTGVSHIAEKSMREAA